MSIHSAFNNNVVIATDPSPGMHRRLRYGHCIWHVFVMAGITCHFFVMFWYAA